MVEEVSYKFGNELLVFGAETGSSTQAAANQEYKEPAISNTDHGTTTTENIKNITGNQHHQSHKTTYGNQNEWNMNLILAACSGKLM